MKVIKYIIDTVIEMLPGFGLIAISYLGIVGLWAVFG